MIIEVASYRADDLHRRHPLRPLLGELVRLPVVERLELAPFTAGEMREYLRVLVHRAKQRFRTDYLRRVATKAGRATPLG